MGANERDAMQTLVQRELHEFRAPIRSPLTIAVTFLRALLLASLVASAAWILLDSVFHLSTK